MTKAEFTAKAYEILSANGYEVINEKIYFPESSVLDMLEWMHENANTVVDVDKALSRVLIAIEKIVK